MNYLIYVTLSYAEIKKFAKENIAGWGSLWKFHRNWLIENGYQLRKRYCCISFYFWPS